MAHLGQKIALGFGPGQGVFPRPDKVLYQLVEGIRQHLDLIPGFNLQPVVQVAGADDFGPLAQGEDGRRQAVLEPHGQENRYRYRQNKDPRPHRKDRQHSLADAGACLFGEGQDMLLHELCRRDDFIDGRHNPQAPCD